MHGRCHVGPWLIEFSGVAPSCFTSVSGLTTVWDVKPEDMFCIVQGNSLFSVMDQETCEWLKKKKKKKKKKKTHVCLCNNKCLFTSLCSPPYGEAVRSAARTLMLAFSQVPYVSGLCQTMPGDNLTSTELIHVRLIQTVATSAELTWVRWFKPCMKQSTT